MRALANGIDITHIRNDTQRAQYYTDIDLAICKLDDLLLPAATKRRAALCVIKSLTRGLTRLKADDKKNTVGVALDMHSKAVFLAQALLSGIKDASSLRTLEIQLVLQALRACRNELAYISRLPAEIMDLILTYSSPQPRPDDTFFKSPLLLKSSIAVTQACQSLRSAAETSQNFGPASVFRAPDGRWRCCSTASLTPKAKAARDLILAQLWRIRELSLDLRFLSDVSFAIFKPAPMLEVCKLHCLPSLNLFVLDKNLFAGDAPRLRHLSLAGCRLEWNSPLLVNLTVLCFANVVSLDLDLSEFIAVLAGLTMLEELHLEKSMPRHIGFRAEHPPVLNLQRLVLRDSAMACVSFLEGVDFPETRIVVRSHLPLWSQFCALDVLSLRSVGLCGWYSNDVGIEFWGQPYRSCSRSALTTEPSHPAPLRLPYPDRLQRTLLVLPVQNIRFLTIQIPMISPRIFPVLGELHTLIIRSYLRPGTFKADPLMHAKLALESPDTSAVYIPKLRELELSC